MSIADKLTTIAENQQKVFDAGAKAESDRFWDEIQKNGTRNTYERAFSQWSSEYIRPKYKVVPITSTGVQLMFSGCQKLRKVEAEYFDFSQKETGTTNTQGYYYVFSDCYALEEIEDIGLIPQNNYQYAFRRCRKLHTIAKMGVDENTKFSNTFEECAVLENLMIDGTIGQNGFDVHWSTSLTHDSLMSIINALGNKTGTSGTSWVCTLGSANLAKLTDTEKAIATQKGWTLA